MPATVQEVQEIIREAFPDSDVSHLAEENHRVVGTVYWDGFQNMPPRERNRLMTERVRDRLGLKGLNVGVLFPLVRGETL